MHTFIVDIETVPKDFDALDDASKEYLTKFAESDDDIEKIRRQMALWAPTNEIVAIGMLSVEQQKGAVYFQNDGGVSEKVVEGPFTFRTGSEKEILEYFWAAMRHAKVFVTFNGRRFDSPVLMLRSAINGVRPTKNLMPYRYASDIHVDLLEQLTFYGAARKFNLDMFCKAFGIDSPKAHGITGHDVAQFYRDGKFVAIAQYCAGDLWATRELYLRWKKYLRF